MQTVKQISRQLTGNSWFNPVVAATAGGGRQDFLTNALPSQPVLITWN